MKWTLPECIKQLLKKFKPNLNQLLSPESIMMTQFPGHINVQEFSHKTKQNKQKDP